MAKFRSVLLLLLIIYCLPTFGQTINQDNSNSIWNLPNLAEEDIDIGYWALVIAKHCDSSVDIIRYLLTLDTMAAEIIRMVGGRNSDMAKMLMAKTYQFDSGAWNDENIFIYDLDDPLGEKSNARLLTTYLDTHKGNCVSMPTLFLALMERVDSKVAFNGVSAPLHLFCRLNNRDDSSVWNVECTNGGNPARNDWYIESFGISQKSIEKGAYLRDLTKKEFVGELIGILVSKYRREEKYKRALQYAELMLGLNPKSINGLVQKGALLAWIGHTLLERQIAENRVPTMNEELELRLYKDESEKYIEQARSLGWQPETQEFRKQYLKSVRDAREADSK